MTKEKILELQKKVFCTIEMENKEELIPTVLKSADDSFPIDVLSMIVYDLGNEESECMGEFAFLNIDEQEELQTLTGVVTLTDNISMEHFGELLEAINALNYYIPYGNFSVSRSDKNLVYKISSPIPVSLSEDQLYAQVELFISNSFLMVDKYIDILFDIASGTKKADIVYEITGV